MTRTFKRFAYISFPNLIIGTVIASEAKQTPQACPITITGKVIASPKKKGEATPKSHPQY
jgi:hypothetical protein